VFYAVGRMVARLPIVSVFVPNDLPHIVDLFDFLSEEGPRGLRFEPVDRNTRTFEIIIPRDRMLDGAEAVLRAIHDFPKCAAWLSMVENPLQIRLFVIVGDYKMPIRPREKIASFPPGSLRGSPWMRLIFRFCTPASGWPPRWTSSPSTGQNLTRLN
jgi:predicted DCC family thiol-disulfide oxidoreductase YuxK